VVVHCCNSIRHVGFFSKDAILGAVWVQGNLPLYNSLYWVGVAGAFLTSIYTFRLIWVVFFGEEKHIIMRSMVQLIGAFGDSCCTFNRFGYFLKHQC
jgi:NADH:ubiquinone oxidoreductase subunit 5 (subunit L)/multisubunit Na+/H+ antiporter MnhA subunit